MQVERKIKFYWYLELGKPILLMLAVMALKNKEACY